LLAYAKGLSIALDSCTAWSIFKLQNWDPPGLRVKQR
jgi:hypothetical protein